MPIGEICNREVVITGADDTVLHAANLMRKHHVGDLLVVKQSNGSNIPIGIVTDRDLVVEVLAPEVDPKTLNVGDIMTSELTTVKEDVGVFEAIRFMRIKGIRRLPVVDDKGSLIGVVTLDDLLELLVEELGLLVKLIAHEQQKEASDRP
ncbi:MAG: CBS domain-containing protein [Methylotenera sp.]